MSILSAGLRQVERCVQTFNQEFIKSLTKFLGGSKVKYPIKRLIYPRFHRGAKAFPADLFEDNVGKLT
ncbi:MAG: hypothetical protein ABSA75_13955 [Candidatus Bathyarchaeia archaeon]